MEYYVVGADGGEYGPATVETLRDWAAQNRLMPNSILKNSQTGQQVTASSVPGIFAPPPPVGSAPPPGGAWAQPPTAYPRQTPNYTPAQDNATFHRSLIYSGVSLAFVFLLGGLGVVSAIFSLYYAIQTQKDGHKHGFVAIIAASVAVLVAGIAFAIRVSHRMS